MRRANALLVVVAAGCAHAGAMLRPEVESLPFKASSGVLSEDHFKRDLPAALSEEDLRRILDSPVYLDETQRLGVLPVEWHYLPDSSIPIPPVPAELTRSLEAAGLFQATSEISADWPADRDLPGLRELAARYRSGYLLLYRHRFADDNSANGWCWLYPTIIGAIVAPSRTLETEGVLEATLFDVRTGTVLFTVFERVRGKSDETPWNDGRKLQALKMSLLREGGEKLAAQVVAKVRRLVAMKPGGKSPAAAAALAVPSF